jgi:broad specificity phosphatase PhoE
LCLPLAEKLRSYQLSRLISSTEPKAHETARLAAEHLHLPFATALGLHEHKRSNVPWVSPEVHQANLAALFTRPGELVMGDETAEQAGTRFIDAVDQVLEQYPNETLAIVSHATVMALFVANFNPTIHPFDYWRQLQMPDITVLERSTRRLLLPN